MRKLERIIIALIGIVAAVLPIVLRLRVFQEDTQYTDGEFWGVLIVAGFLFGMVCLWSAISGERAFYELGVFDDSES